MITEKELLHYIGKQPRHMAGFKQIVHDLALRGKERRSLEELLHELARRRQLVAIGKERWALPIASSGQRPGPGGGVARGRGEDLVAGELRMHRDGFGFVVPNPDSLPARARGKLQGDIFVPPPAIGSAVHGDQVLVELGPIHHDGRAEGRIVRVVHRRHETVVGKFHYGSRHNYVSPIDEKLTMEIVIPPGMERPREEETRHRVLGDEVKRGSAHQTSGAQPPSAASTVRGRGRPRSTNLGEGDLENMVVEVEIIQWPSASQSPRGRVIEILGREDDFGVDVEIVIRKHHIRHVFPDAVLEEAQEISPVIHHRELDRRQDYRDLPIVTIDGESARDFDDAVLVRRLENGNYELHVHIADVAHYVEDGSAIDEEARKRGTSVYFPDRAVPMLPLELSTDLCSLRPEVERLVLSCVMEIDGQGEIAGYELAEGVIRSAARMTYTDVNAIIEGDPALRRRYAGLAEDFDLMYELAKVLNHKRVKRGSIDFDLPEPVIKFDDWGLMKSISPSERNWAHRLIEEFMLAANETVATHLERRGFASLYRIHEKPDPKRIYEFETIAASFGYSLGVGSLPVKRMQMRADKRSHYGSGRRPPLVELPEEVHVTPRMYQKLAQKIAGKPEERILSFLMLRSLKQARYSEINEGHFALAAPAYTHFTSPIRRYPDLIVHRILKAVLREQKDHGEQPPSAADEDDHRRGRLRSPWSKGTDSGGDRRKPLRMVAGLSEQTLHDIADTSSQTERAADEAERELLEWKKLQFMEDRLGEEFDGLIVSVTRFGFFVELNDLFIEGLVPIDSLEEDHYTFRENTRQIIGSRTRKTYSIGDKARVLVDRIDHGLRKVQFAVVEEKEATNKKRRKRG
ncbi:MAG TPA: RNB domain-containing ribonuclease [Candidatus Angelobacter sp.]|nr:RNB domain-containing ribonuclease [Candidatus Angelobacter sp.]